MKLLRKRLRIRPREGGAKTEVLAANGSIRRLRCGEPGITTTYAATGKKASMVDASGTTTWAYDNQDRVLTKSTPQGALSYTYLPNSLVASVNSSNANGYSVNYARYDAGGPAESSQKDSITVRTQNVSS